MEGNRGSRATLMPSRPALAVGAAVFASVLLWALALSAADIDFTRLFRLSEIEYSMGALVSPAFILFVVLFPFTYAIAGVAAKHLSNREALAATVAPAAAAGLAAFALCGSMAAQAGMYAVLGVFYLGSLVLAMHVAGVKFSELKSLVLPRAMMASAGMGITVLALGLLICTGGYAYANQQQYADDLGTMIESASKGAAQGLGEKAADIVVGAKLQTLQEIAESEEFGALLLKAGSDLDVQQFIAMLAANAQEYSSPEYKAGLVSQVESAAGAQLGDTRSIARKALPWFGMMEKIMWTFQPVMLFVTLLTLGIVIKPLAAVYGTLIGLLAEVLRPAEAAQSL